MVDDRFYLPEEDEKKPPVVQRVQPVAVAPPPPPPPVQPTPSPEPNKSPVFDIFKVLIAIGIFVLAVVILFKPFDVSAVCPSMVCPKTQNITIPPCPSLPGVNVTCGNQSLECPKSLYYINYTPTNETCELLNYTMLNVTNVTQNCTETDLNITLTTWFPNGTMIFNESVAFIGNGTYNFTDLVVTNYTYTVKING